MISILLKTAFWQTSIHSQSLLKILWWSDKDKITSKAIEKHQYRLPKTVSKHLIKFFSYSLLIKQNASYKRTLKIDPATPNDMNSLPLAQITIWCFLRLKTFQLFMETGVFRFKCRRLNCNQEQTFFWSACKTCLCLIVFPRGIFQNVEKAGIKNKDTQRADK